MASPYPVVVQEIALNLIIERKRYDDLVQSLMAGRYQEQRSRLRKTGMSRVLFIVGEAALLILLVYRLVLCS